MNHCGSQIHFQSSDFVWQNWRATGPNQAEFSIEESASSACAAKHDRVTGEAWLKQASSGASCLHSFKLISVPAHCKAFAATGDAAEACAPILCTARWRHNTNLKANLSASHVGRLTVQATYRTISTCLHFHLQQASMGGPARNSNKPHANTSKGLTRNLPKQYSKRV